MKFTLSWLKDHLETDAPLAAIAQAMTMAGLEVEEVEDPAARLGQFTVARIVVAAQHPNADKLQVCQVETKDGRLEIVCGALNARPGLVTAFAPIGAFIPGSGITLEAKPVRGVVSNGMLCSESEMEVEDDPFGLRAARFDAWKGRAAALGLDEAKARADGGILELPDDAPVGASVAKLLGLEPVVDFEVTPNRPDWLGVVGIARDLAAAGVGKFKERAIEPVPGAFPCPIVVTIDDESACPVFAGRLVRGVKNGPSPAWLQARLRAVGLKPRNALVDVTNFLSLDRARPLHVYDASKLNGTVRARLGRAGERFKALDGKEYEVTPAMCVIADDAGVLGLGGVMGGEASGSSEATTDVFVESAWFDPIRTTETGRATGIASDAQARFARGVDPGFVLPGLELATRLILELCGGEPSDIVVVGEAPAPPKPLAFDPARVRTLAGLDVPVARVKAILTDLGFAVKGTKTLTVTPPSFRRDVAEPADLVEEIARIVGFDHLPTVQPPRAEGFRPPPASVGESRARLARRALAAAGYAEAVSWSFCETRHAALFGLNQAQIAQLTLANPIAADLDCMRPTPLPNLLRMAQKNVDRGRPGAALFEIGPAYLGDGEADQRRVAAAVRHVAPQRHWKGASTPDVFDAKRDCLMALEAAGANVAGLQVAGASAPWQHPGRGGAFKLGPKTLALFGEVHPRVLAGLDVEGPMLAFEIDLDAIPAPKAKPTHARPPFEKLDLMPVSRDFAFLVDEAVAAADLARAALGADKALIADVSLFDVYRGQGVPDGKKSLALEIVLQPREKTLTDADIEAVSTRIVAAAAKAVGATLRG